MGRDTWRDRWTGERGSVVPIVALLALALGGLIVGVGQVGADVVLASRARAAADAAALAGAAEGEQAARRLAAANGGRLVTYAVEGAEVQVTVAVGDAEAVARAERTAVGGGRAAGVIAAGLTPEMRAAIAAAEAVLGRMVPITSGWRSSAAQQALWDRRATNPFPVARPGASSHERGTAIDVPRSFAPTLAAIAAKVGLCRPLPTSDPVHFELCGASERSG